MRIASTVISAALILFSLTACTQNRVVIIPVKAGVNAASPPGSSITEHQFVVAEPCLLAPQDIAASNYGTGKVIGGGSAPMSDRAKAENAEGCATVRFRLMANGIPTDVQLVKENPQDYGFGQQILQMVQASTYAGLDDKPIDTNRWYLQTSSVTHTGNFTRVFSGGPDHYAKYADFFRHSHQ